MWSLLVVVSKVGLEHPLEMPTTVDQDLVEALAAHGPHEPLGEGIRPRCPDRGSDDPDALGAEHRIEGYEEIGLSAETMGSPITAAAGSLLAFAVGASVPLVPYLLLTGAAAFALSIAGTLIALFLVGLGVSRLTHRHPVRSGLRQAALGLLAAAVTYGVGTLLGTAVR